MPVRTALRPGVVSPTLPVPNSIDRPEYAWKPTARGSTTLNSRNDNPAEVTSFCQGMVKKFFIAPSRWTPRVSLYLQALSLPRKQEAQRPQLVFG